MPTLIQIKQQSINQTPQNFSNYQLPNRMEFRSLDEFWGYYMGQHSKTATRRWHFAGTLSALLCLLFSLLLGRPWLIVLCPLLGYGMAWYSHFFVEHNSPASLGHPVWSLLCDFKLFGLMLTGRLEREMKRLGKRPLHS